MTLDEQINEFKKKYIVGKSVFQKDEDRADEFDQMMTKIVENVRADAYTAFRLMYESELEEAVRHVSEIRFDEGVDACEMQGTIQRPDNPYTKEAVAKAKQDLEKGDDDA